MPIETMAKRGVDTIRYGPLKPIGLIDPRTGKEPYACVQLRQDNTAATLYNMVGFQTRLAFPEQRRVFALIPPRKRCVWVRYGVMHRNTFICSPNLLTSEYRMRGAFALLCRTADRCRGICRVCVKRSDCAGLAAGLTLCGIDNDERQRLLPGITVLSVRWHTIYPERCKTLSTHERIIRSACAAGRPYTRRSSETACASD